MTRKEMCPRQGNAEGHKRNNRRHYSTLDEFAYEYAPRGLVFKYTAILAVILLAAMVIGQVTA